MKSGLFILLVASVLELASSQTGENAKALRQKLFVTDQYDKKVRSAKDQTNPTAVYVSFNLLSINELNEVTETLKSTGYLRIDWKDDYLTWNTSEFGGLPYAFFPQDDVWKPDVALKNSMVDYKQLGVASLNVQVTADGEVLWYPFQIFQSSCSVDITYFPFDIQTCKLKFVAWSYTKNEQNVFVMKVVEETFRQLLQKVDIQGGSKGIDLSEYESNSEWEVIDSNHFVEEESGEALISFSLKIKRKPRYLFLAIIFPIIMLTILNLLVFVLPCDSGEKASYAITVFLAFAVFLTIVSGSLPENSDTLSLFSIYIIIQTIQSTLITVLALIFIRLYNLGPEIPIPSYFLAVVTFLVCTRCRNKKSSIKPSRGYETNETDHSAKDSLHTSKVELSRQQSIEAEKQTEGENYDWKRVVNTLDWLCLIFFSTVAFLSTLICIVMASSLAR